MVPKLDSAWCEAERWKLVVLGRWSRPGAIHNKEARAALLGHCREARFASSFNKRLLSLGDNLAEVLSFDRGRARD